MPNVTLRQYDSGHANYALDIAKTFLSKLQTVPKYLPWV